MKGVKIEQLGVSFDGEIVRRHNKETDRTTISLTEDQAREVYAALGPVLEFFDSQHDDDLNEIVDGLESLPTGTVIDGVINNEPAKAK
jgi:hypothetical protein